MTVKKLTKVVTSLFVALGLTVGVAAVGHAASVNSVIIQWAQGGESKPRIANMKVEQTWRFADHMFVYSDKKVLSSTRMNLLRLGDWGIWHTHGSKNLKSHPQANAGNWGKPSVAGTTYKYRLEGNNFVGESSIDKKTRITNYSVYISY